MSRLTKARGLLAAAVRGKPLPMGHSETSAAEARRQIPALSGISQRLYPLAFAGFYLDEHFTRLTFRLWPVRAPQVSPLATGDRP